MNILVLLYKGEGRDNVSTIQRTEAKETEMDSRIDMWPWTWASEWTHPILQGRELFIVSLLNPWITWFKNYCLIKM